MHDQAELSLHRLCEAAHRLEDQPRREGRTRTRRQRRCELPVERRQPLPAPCRAPPARGRCPCRIPRKTRPTPAARLLRVALAACHAVEEAAPRGELQPRHRRVKRVEEWCEVRQLGHRRKPPQRRAAIDLVVSVPKIEAHDHVLGLRAQVGSHAVYEDIQAVGDSYCHLVGCQVVGERACGLGVRTYVRTYIHTRCGQWRIVPPTSPTVRHRPRAVSPQTAPRLANVCLNYVRTYTDTVRAIAHGPTSPTATGRALFLLRPHRASECAYLPSETGHAAC